MANEKERMFERDPATGKLKYIPGSWRKMFAMPKWYVFLVVIVVVMSYVMVKDMTDVYNNPCEYCKVSGCIANPYANYTLLPVAENATGNLSGMYKYVASDAPTTKLIS